MSLAQADTLGKFMLRRENVYIVGDKARFANRQAAGERLAYFVSEHVREQKLENVVVLGLPKGGIVVAAPIAQTLGVPLDFVITRKLLSPHQTQLAIGAVTERGRAFLNKPIIEALSIGEEYIQKEIEHEQEEIKRFTAAYRSVMPATELTGKTVIVADDNVITGSTMFATLRGLWAERPNHIILALPVAPRDTLMSLGDFADYCIALRAPAESFTSMKDYFEEFPEVTDKDVTQILQTHLTQMVGHSSN